MADNIHNRLVKGLEKVSGEIYKKSQFTSHSLLSPKERFRIIKEYDDLNKRIAEKYLKNKSLFLEPWPDPDELWKPYDVLSLEKVIQIQTSLWAEQQKQIIHLTKTIQKINPEKNNQNINDLDLAGNFSFLKLIKAIGKKMKAKFLLH